MGETVMKNTIFFALAFLARATIALGADYISLDLNNLNLVYKQSANPAQVSVNIVTSPSTRTAFTQTAPLLLPCDVNFLAGSIRMLNISAQTLYPTIEARVFLGGNEARAVPNAWGQTPSSGPSNAIIQPGQLGQAGYIFFHPVLVNYGVGQFPPNLPVKLVMGSRATISPTYQPVLPEDVIWNNYYAVWVMKSCP